MNKRGAIKHHHLHIAHFVLLALAIGGTLYGGDYYIQELRTDYGSQIEDLNEKIGVLEGKLDSESNRISVLSGEISINSVKVDNRLGDLNQQLSDIAVTTESFSGVIDEVLDSVVSVLTNVGQGSGAIISSDGYVVTNHHVIKGATQATLVDYNGERYTVTLVGSNEEQDLAVLKIVGNKTFEAFEFGDSSKLKAGQKVVALGNPAGLDFTATEGIVSSPNRVAPDGFNYIQTDTTLNPGNSGGPLINSNGRMIGVVVFKLDGFEELNFAIPSNRAKSVIEEIVGRDF